VTLGSRIDCALVVELDETAPGQRVMSRGMFVSTQGLNPT